MPDSFRKIRIGHFQNPTLFVTVDFDKNGYSYGDNVVAKIKVRRSDGEILLTGTSVAYKVSSDSSQDKSMLLLNS